VSTHLRYVRIQQGYTLRALAAKMGTCTHNAIYCWEKGWNNPNPASAKRLEDVLGVPRAVLLAPNNDQGHQSDSPGALVTSTESPRNHKRRNDCEQY
jgi:transcriptional regulator with XRE-family HTH domain